MASLFDGIPEDMSQERFHTICRTGGVTIERIVSRGHASPEGFWYDQDRTEFVLVVQGSAAIRFDTDDREVVLHEGDYLTIGAHVKHRVEWTDPSCDTIWLAVYC